MEIITVVNAAETPEAPKKTSRPSPKDTAKSVSKKPVATENPAAVDQLNKATLKLIAKTINDLADENGWAFLGDIGNLLLKKQPNFDPRNFGFPKLTPLLKSLPQFEIDKRETEKGGTKLVFIRNHEMHPTPSKHRREDK